MSRAAGAAGAVGALMAAGLTGCAAATQTDAVDYRDGTYQATGWYGSLPSHQDVTLTLEDDLIVDVTITAPAEDPTSLEHQHRFAEALDDEIVGRDIDTIALDRLAGASGCSEGFMNALAEIKSSAGI